MPCILYSESCGAYAYLGDRWLPGFGLPEGDLSIPCEAGADVNDQERWRGEAAAMRQHGWPAPSLAMAKALKNHELMLARDREVMRGFQYQGHTFPLLPDVQLSLLVQFQGSLAMPAPAYEWKDVGGVYRPIGDAKAFQAFASMAMAYGEGLYVRERELQKLVDAARTMEDVAAVQWGAQDAPDPDNTDDSGAARETSEESTREVH